MKILLLFFIIENISEITVLHKLLILSYIDKLSKMGYMIEKKDFLIKNIREDVIRLDKNECKNYLTEFLEDMKKGIEKTDIEKQRATEVYDHYTNDLKLNSYIHTEWERLMG